MNAVAFHSSAPAVLFVNIGWADRYDGTEEIRGNHSYLQGHAKDNAERSAFLPDRDGVYSCGIGRGLIGVTSLDIVFVAADDRRTPGHYAVGFYRKAWWRPDEGSDNRPWVRAHTTTAHLIPTEHRPVVTWPGRMDMRRWARRSVGNGREHEHLYRNYHEIVALSERLQASSSTPTPRVQKPAFNAHRPALPALPAGALPKVPPRSSPLALRIDADLLVLREGASETHKQLHNEMTNALRKICLRRNLRVEQGVDATSRYDALIRQHDGSERDLLIEVKTSVEPPFCRMDVGQLLDYRRPLANRESTDLAVLFPERPGAHVRAFLADVLVKALWLTPDRLRIQGDLSL